jgi:salicylate hydroxylase
VTAALPILIAGGGIGGLSAAIALARIGIPVHVLEAAPTFAELGAGVQIGPNGMRILARWGLAEGLEREGKRPERLLLRDGLTGVSLARLPLGEAVQARYGAPYVVMSRQALHQRLLAAATAAPNVAITCGTRVAEWALKDGKVVVSSAGGGTIDGRALIAADGVHSALRDRLFRGARAVPSGRTALRALAPLPRNGEDAEAVSVWMAPDAHLVHYPLAGLGQLNLVAVLRDEDVPDGSHVESTHLRTAFHRWCFDAQLLLASAGTWMKWPLWTMAPLERWARGPVTLLGDAAHPVLPFLASGAVMAIEDAAILAQEVGRSRSDCAAAFQRYERRRLPRLAQLRKAVERTGQIYHMDGLTRVARNTALAVLPERTLMARNDWLYGFDA